MVLESVRRMEEKGREQGKKGKASSSLLQVGLQNLNRINVYLPTITVYKEKKILLESHSKYEIMGKCSI